MAKLPCVWRRAEDDNIVSRGTGEGASLIVIRIAVGTWTSVLEELRVPRWLARVRRGITFATAVLRVPKCLARAPAGHAPPSVRTRHLQLGWTRPVQVHQTSGGRAPAAFTSLGHDQHREVVTVDQADIIEI